MNSLATMVTSQFKMLGFFFSSFLFSPANFGYILPVASEILSQSLHWLTSA